jgi:hypothetical protein
MKRTLLVLVASIFLVLGGVAFAANNHTINLVVNSFGVVNLNPGNNITLTLDGTGVTAGSSTITTTNNVNWIQYTFITVAGASTVNVALGAGTAFQAWMQLQVTAAAPAAGGGGTKGSGSTVTLTPAMAATALITGIGSCYTGSTASTDGSQLTYTLGIVPAQIGSAVATNFGGYTVTYTVTP